LQVRTLQPAEIHEANNHSLDGPKTTPEGAVLVTLRPQSSL